MINTKHLTPDSIRALKNGSLTGEQAISALEHIGECDRCADALAGSYHDADLLELPRGFKPSVFSAVKGEQGKAIQRRTQTERKRELFRYSFRVSLAACITLLLLFSGTIDYGINFSRSIHTDLPEVNSITENVRGFSEKLVDFEIMKYFKEQKEE